MSVRRWVYAGLLLVCFGVPLAAVMMGKRGTKAPSRKVVDERSVIHESGSPVVVDPLAVLNEKSVPVHWSNALIGKLAATSAGQVTLCNRFEPGGLDDAGVQAAEEDFLAWNVSDPDCFKQIVRRVDAEDISERLGLHGDNHAAAERALEMKILKAHPVETSEAFRGEFHLGGPEPDVSVLEYLRELRLSSSCGDLKQSIGFLVRAHHVYAGRYQDVYRKLC